MMPFAAFQEAVLVMSLARQPHLKFLKPRRTPMNPKPTIQLQELMRGSAWVLRV